MCHCRSESVITHRWRCTGSHNNLRGYCLTCCKAGPSVGQWLDWLSVPSFRLFLNPPVWRVIAVFFVANLQIDYLKKKKTPQTCRKSYSPQGRWDDSGCAAEDVINIIWKLYNNTSTETYLRGARGLCPLHSSYFTLFYYSQY